MYAILATCMIDIREDWRITYAEAGRAVSMAPDRKPPSVRGRQLAAQLRRMREVATLTGDETAKRLGWSASKLSRIENAQTPVSPPDLERILDAYGVSGSR